MPKNNRSQFERTPHNDLIIDAYNANPTSMKAALDFFVKIPSTLPKAVILGEMKELGEISGNEHRKLVEFLSAQSFGKVYLVGEAFADVAGEEIFVFESAEQLIEALQKNPIEGYYILLKGSHSVHLEKVVPFL